MNISKSALNQKERVNEMAMVISNKNIVLMEKKSRKLGVPERKQSKQSEQKGIKEKNMNRYNTNESFNKAVVEKQIKTLDDDDLK